MSQDTSGLSPAALAALARIQQPPVKDLGMVPHPDQESEKDPAAPKTASAEDIAHATRSVSGTSTQQNDQQFAGSEIATPGAGVPPSNRNSGVQSTSSAPGATAGNDPVAPKTAAQLRAELAFAEERETRAAEAYRKAQVGDGKTFFTRVSSSTFIVQKKDKDGKALIGQCKVLQFKGHMLHVLAEDKDDLEQLNEVADLPGSVIYTRPEGQAPTAEELAAFNEVKNQAGNTVAKIAAAGGRA